MTTKTEEEALPAPGTDSAWTSVPGFRVHATLDADNNITHVAWVREEYRDATEN